MIYTKGDNLNRKQDDTSQKIGMHVTHESPGECPLKDSDDKFGEAHYFYHKMADEYHEPQNFRYCLNAFLSALKSVTDRVRVDLERVGQAKWMKVHKARLIHDDPVLKRFFTGRNIVVHQKEIARGSHVEIGIFRFQKLKLAMMADVVHDRSSAELIQSLQASEFGQSILDPEHSAFWEQFGVKRTYLFPELSVDEDAYTASARALVRISRLMEEAHKLLDRSFGEFDESEIDSLDIVGKFNVLLESDLDPEAPQRWGWADPMDVSDWLGSVGDVDRDEQAPPGGEAP